MKPVRELIIGKSGEETIRFNPTARQILFAIEKAKAPGESDYELAKRAGVDPSNPIKWAQKYGSLYLAWLEEFVESAQGGREEEVLHAVGMIHALQGNYQFWNSLAKKHGVISEEPKEMKVTLNTNFTILQGESFDDARRRLLETHRGLVNPRGPGVANTPQLGLPGSSASPGDRTIEVPSRSVALEDPLGKDGRQSEPGTALPAMAKRSPPKGANPLLGKQKKSPRT